MLSALVLVFSPDPSKAFNLAQVVSGMRIAVVLYVALKARDVHISIEQNVFMDGAFPNAGMRRPKPNFPIWMPSAVVNPLATVAGQAVDFAHPQRP